jgi:sec-independent protein translocase protein TatB
MFDIGWGELLIIGMVALIAIGPKELPGVLRTLGQWMGKIRRMASDFQGQFQEAMREAEMAEVRKEFESITEAVPKLDTALDLPSANESWKAPAASESAESANPSAIGATAAPPETLPQSTEVVAPAPEPASQLAEAVEAGPETVPQSTQAVAPAEPDRPSTPSPASAPEETRDTPRVDGPKTESLQGRPA